MNTSTDVPSFKIARVGKERKKKGGALSWLRSTPRGNGSWAGAGSGGAAGTGAGGGLAGMLAGAGKFFTMIALVAMTGASAAKYLNNKALAARVAEQKAAAKKFVPKSEPVKYEGDLSNLPSSKNTIPNSLGYVDGNAGGPTAEEVAAAAAAEEAKKKAAEDEAKKKAEEEAALAAAQQQGDPNAAAAAPGGRLGSKFGQLSSSLGGKGSSLAGGSGMAGGVNRNFGSLGSLGGGLKAGKTGGYNMGSRVNYSKGTRPAVGNSAGRTLARRQLARVNTFSRMANGQTGENASALASAGWDNNSGEGNVITGAGVGNGQAPKPANPDSVDDGGPVGGGGGGGAGNGPQTCQYGYNSDGSCKPKESEGDKYGWMLDVATGLMVVVAIWAGLATAFYGKAWLHVFSLWASSVMLAIGLIIAALGAAYMLATGDTGGGGMIATLAGGLIAAIAYLCPQQAMSSNAFLMCAGAGVLGALGTQSARSKDTAGQQ